MKKNSTNFMDNVDLDLVTSFLMQDGKACVNTERYKFDEKSQKFKKHTCNKEEPYCGSPNNLIRMQVYNYKGEVIPSAKIYYKVKVDDMCLIEEFYYANFDLTDDYYNAGMRRYECERKIHIDDWIQYEIKKCGFDWYLDAKTSHQGVLNRASKTIDKINEGVRRAKDMEGQYSIVMGENWYEKFVENSQEEINAYSKIIECQEDAVYKLTEQANIVKEQIEFSQDKKQYITDDLLIGKEPKEQ